MKKGVIVLLIVLVVIFGGISLSMREKTNQSANLPEQNGKLISGAFDKAKLKTDAEWKKILTPDQYHILREAGTEIPFTGALDHENRPGTYFSAGCNEPVFRSEQKYDSGTGWPSFWAPIAPDALVLKEDDSIPGEPRTEVLDKCGGHLGHVFDDGPQPTGKRYCMNSLALYFVADKSTLSPHP